MSTYLLMITFRVWFCEIAVSGINYFVLMRRVYELRFGVRRAHRIGMTTRIVYIFPFAYVLVRVADVDTVPQMLLAGTFWLSLVLTFEWVWSFILRRPVHEGSNAGQPVPPRRGWDEQARITGGKPNPSR